jgi:signal transduction histidine kinase/CHASE1-domain containing sensor protein/ActR/RegA family two-component response regulator
MPAFLTECPSAYRYAAAVVFITVLIVSWVAAAHADRLQRQFTREEFAARSAATVEAIENRIAAYEAMLRAGEGVALASWPIRQDTWRTFVSNLRLASVYPGIQGVGVSLLVSNAESASLVDSMLPPMARTGSSTWPAASQNARSAIVLLEPQDERNIRALGFDMLSEPVRRAAMERARDEGLPSLSRKVRLVQETSQDVQPGFLLYVPLYKQHMPLETVDERRAALTGFIYSPFRARDFMLSTLGTAPADMQLEVFDGAQTHPDALLFRSTDQDTTRSAAVEVIRPLSLPGAQWTIRFVHTGSESAPNRRLPTILGVTGAVISLLLSGMIVTLGVSRFRLTRIAAQLTRLDLLQRITQAIGARQDLPSIFSVVLRSLEDSMPIDFGCVCLYDPIADALSLARVGPSSTARATAAGLSEHIRLVANSSGLGRCVGGELLYEPEALTVEATFSQQLARVGLHSFVAAPLLVENKVFGVMVAAREVPHAFSSRDCEFLRQLSEHIALASHQTQLYGALQQAYDDLRQSQHTMLQQERLRALGQMASGIAHDINNALSPISLYTESLLEREPTLSQRAHEYLATIRRSIEDVTNTVARMREFYRHREPELSLQPLDLNALTQQIIVLTRPRWWDLPQQRGIMIELRTDLVPSLPTTMGAESELRDALTNLIFNAIDAMPGGGVLTVRTRLMVSGSDGDQTQSVVLEVQDTGVGMDAQTRQRCLEPFFTTKGERGTGLGLAMVYGMIRRHSAELEIDSEPGAGTTVRLIFGVFLPLTLASAHTPAGPPSRRVRILIVDDDPLLIKSLCDILEADGHLVSTADGGQAGINSFAQAVSGDAAFGLVITDLGMPYVDGRKVAEAIKHRSPLTPVVMLTGWGRRMLADNDVPHYVDRVLSKPPRIHELRQAISDFIKD